MSEKKNRRSKKHITMPAFIWVPSHVVKYKLILSMTMQETWVQSLGQKDALEKGMAAQSSILHNGSW